ncbi:MAG: hypothetical protein AB7O62_11405 [Pirellulales bacterium]
MSTNPETDLTDLANRLEDASRLLTDLRQAIVTARDTMLTPQECSQAVLSAMQQHGQRIDDAMARIETCAKQAAGIPNVRRSIAFGGIGPAKFT